MVQTIQLPQNTFQPTITLNFLYYYKVAIKIYDSFKKEPFAPRSTTF